MQKTEYTIADNSLIARDTLKMVLQAGGPGREGNVPGQQAGGPAGQVSNPGCQAGGPAWRAGQFMDIAIEGTYLRRPISVCDATGELTTIIYKVVGRGTAMMSRMHPGESLEVLAPLGHGFSPDCCKDSALLIGGGLGAAPLVLLCKELLEKGKHVSVVTGFNTKAEIILRDEYRRLGIDPLISTMDGSEGIKGFVTDAIINAAPEFDRFYCCGPMPMMKAVCQTLSTPGEASLEERMGCGAGFCYGCSVMTTGGAKTVCKDGPVFNKEELIW